MFQTCFSSLLFRFQIINRVYIFLYFLYAAAPNTAFIHIRRACNHCQCWGHTRLCKPPYVPVTKESRANRRNPKSCSYSTIIPHPWSKDIHTPHVYIKWGNPTIMFMQGYWEKVWIILYHNNPPLVPKVAWCRTGDRPFCDRMIAWFTDVCLRHAVSMC